MIRVISTQEDAFKKILALRNQVLRKPLGLDIQNDDLSDEVMYTHFAYLNEVGEVIACLQVKTLAKDQFQIRQMAVQADYQGGGIGSQLLVHAHLHTQNQGGRSVVIEARDSALSFYERNGYQVQGHGYDKLGIPHHRMIRQLPL